MTYATGGIADTVASEAERLLRSQVRAIEVRSRLTPTRRFVDPFVERPGGGGPPKPGQPGYVRALRWIQPAVILEAGSQRLVWAPYGVPTTTYYEAVKWGAVGTVALAAYGAWSLLRSVARK